jgi:RimJ/RimL family protein N-acetyltransferase
MTVFITTERLILKPTKQSDFDDLFALRSDPDVMKYTEQGVQTKKDVQKFLDITVPYQKKYGHDICSVFEKSSGAFVGQAGLFRTSNIDEQSDIEIGFSLHKKYWGKGYGTELVRALIQWGFEHLSVTKLVAFTDPKNSASHRVLQKCGMINVGAMHGNLSKYEIYKNDSIEFVFYNTEQANLIKIEIKPLLEVYKQRLSLQDAVFLHIKHDDAMVGIVYKVTLLTGIQYILKICTRSEDYFREVYFLKYFANTLPVPGIIQVVQPETDIQGAILMECLPGALLKKADFTEDIAHECGSLLARIHLNRVEGYGDLTRPHELNSDPRVHFTRKFDEGLAECANHLPKKLLQQCRHYYDRHANLLASVDGPCMIHRDFRPGNILVYDGKLQGIIDWSSARASFAEDDFCPLEFGEWPRNPASKKSFLDGYSSIRAVPEYSALMPLLRLNRAIATIGFTIKRGTWENSSAHLYQTNRQFLEAFF